MLLKLKKTIPTLLFIGLASSTACQKKAVTNAIPGAPGMRQSGLPSSAGGTALVNNPPLGTPAVNPPLVPPTSNEPANPSTVSASSASGAQPADAKLHQNAPAPFAEQPEPSCFNVAFQHPAGPGHADLEDCSQHRNVLKLSKPKTGDIFSSTLCVKVDGKPVQHRFSAEKREVELGPLAGPSAVITVRYCTVPAKCDDPCTPEKDEFLDAIAGSIDGESEDTRGAWGSDTQDIHVSSKLSQELEGYGELRVYSAWKQKDSAGSAVKSCTPQKSKVVARSLGKQTVRQ